MFLLFWLVFAAISLIFQNELMDESKPDDEANTESNEHETHETEELTNGNDHGNTDVETFIGDENNVVNSDILVINHDETAEIESITDDIDNELNGTGETLETNEEETQIDETPEPDTNIETSAEQNEESNEQSNGDAEINGNAATDEIETEEPTMQNDDEELNNENEIEIKSLKGSATSRISCMSIATSAKSRKSLKSAKSATSRKSIDGGESESRHTSAKSVNKLNSNRNSAHSDVSFASVSSHTNSLDNEQQRQRSADSNRAKSGSMSRKASAMSRASVNGNNLTEMDENAADADAEDDKNDEDDNIEMPDDSSENVNRNHGVTEIEQVEYNNSSNEQTKDIVNEDSSELEQEVNAD